MIDTRILVAVGLACCFAAEVSAQSQVAAEPIVGLRENRPRDYALVGARVVTRPGHAIENATVLIAGTSITAIGTDVEIPAGAMSIDCTGRWIYPGLIDAWGEADVPLPETESAHWNNYVTPHRSARSVAAGAIESATKLRSQGITVRLVAPRGGIVKGSSSVVLLSQSSGGRALLEDHAWHHLQLTVPRNGPRSTYPNSPMGATALLRQTLYDAFWYRDVWTAYNARTHLPRPESNLALAELSEAIDRDTFVIDAPNERMAIRAENIAQEFSLKMILRGSGREYRQLDEIAATDRPILLPVNFPDPPNVKTARGAGATSLRDLMHWDLAPENPARLHAAGVPICLTTDGLEDEGNFLQQVQVAVDRGLPRDAALEALTTQPASLLGIDDVAGRIEPGMLANLVISDGELFAEETEVMETWVAGEQFIVTPRSDIGVDELTGDWSFRFRSGGRGTTLVLEFKRSDDRLIGSVADPTSSDVQDDGEESELPTAKLTDIVRGRDFLTASVNLHEADPALSEGVSRLHLVTVVDEDQTLTLFGSIVLPDGETAKVQLGFIEDPSPEDTEKEEEEDSSEDGDSEPVDEAAADSELSTPIFYPLGAYGRSQPLPEAEHILFRGATVWTCEEAGKIENGDVRINEGRIVEVGQDLEVPPGCRVIDVRGKHLTPGLIDCHSHMGTDGGVNESGQAVTAEVRIGDFVDNSDINIFRQLAGGLTTSNILHGSANPIGGQNQVIKLRWGETMDGLRMKEAPPGIKFALGENVKRNTSRYPNTRMGVEQIIRDQLLAARQYDAAWRRWRGGDNDSLPPRTDLQLEALAQVQRGQRWIHCHSYRQDEIVATLDVLEEFGIQIGTLQHILEGYKVADRMARHGAMGSAFSDWWAYKFEVFDAIPYNGALMHDRGVIVSFNSDDRELGRHLNAEAAKATKYGGVSEEEALKFVTLNPAKQLRIDQHVGSIRPGKDADLVIWSRRPLSTLTRCEQTWIDGRQYFDLQSEQELRQRDSALRARLIQKALANDGASSKKEEEVEEEDRWQRHDIFCAAHGDAGHQHTGQSR